MSQGETTKMDLAAAERELIQLVRGEDEEKPFTLLISFAPGHWVVEVRSPGQAGAQGDGATFSEAWEQQEPNFPW